MAFIVQVKDHCDLHKFDVKQYMNDSMMLGFVDSDGESDKTVENASHRLAALFYLETSGYMHTLTTFPV